jgi:chromosome segregation ATPase
LEKKINAKNKLLEEKIAKIDSSFFKLEKEAQNIKNSQTLNKRQIEQLKKQIEEINTREENINHTIEQNNEDINDKLDTKVSYLEKYTKDSLDNLNNNLKQKFNTISENKTLEKGSSKDLINSVDFQNMNSENINAIKSLKEAMI